MAVYTKSWTAPPAPPPLDRDVPEPGRRPPPPRPPLAGADSRPREPKSAVSLLGTWAPSGQVGHLPFGQTGTFCTSRPFALWANGHLLHKSAICPLGKRAPSAQVGHLPFGQTGTFCTSRPFAFWANGHLLHKSAICPLGKRAPSAQVGHLLFGQTGTFCTSRPFAFWANGLLLLETAVVPLRQRAPSAQVGHLLFGQTGTFWCSRPCPQSENRGREPRPVLFRIPLLLAPQPDPDSLSWRRSLDGSTWARSGLAWTAEPPLRRGHFGPGTSRRRKRGCCGRRSRTRPGWAGHARSHDLHSPQDLRHPGPP
jgi:hypothetical protein